KVSYVSYTAGPVAGSATAETSATDRILQPLSFWKLGFEKFALQPLPPLFHAPSAQPRAVPGDWVRLVPPTESTFGADAGKLMPYPLSPEAAVISTPGLSKYCDAAIWTVLSSGPP